MNAATFARANAQYVRQLPQLVSACYDNHEILSTLQDDSPVIVPALDAALLYSGLPPLPALQAPSAEGTRIALTPVSSNGTPIPWYEDYNPVEMLAQHSIVSVALALNYRLTQLQGASNGGTGP